MPLSRASRFASSLLGLALVTSVAAAQEASSSLAPSENSTGGSKSAGMLDTIAPLSNPMGEAVKPFEYGVLVQGGTGLTANRGDFKFLAAGVHVGKVLTQNLLNGPLRGNFEYAVEVFPLWQSYTPTFQRAKCTQIFPGGGAPAGTYVSCSAPYKVGGRFTGASITPIVLRWNFVGGKRISPWVQGAGGVVWTNHKYPAFGVSLPSAGTVFGPPDGAGLLANDGPGTDASVWNFTPQFGVGAHYFTRSDRSIDFSANAIHISSASLGDKNPGVNASVQFSVGYTWWK